MKKIITLFLFFPLTVLAQEKKLVALLEKGDKDALQSYYEKGHSLEDVIPLTLTVANDQVTYYIHPLVYVTGKKNLQLVQFYLQKMEEDWEENGTFYQEVIGEAFTVSISRGDEGISDLLYSKTTATDVICEPCNGSNALLIAASYGNEKWYFKLKDSSNLLLENQYGNNLLHCAASGGSVKIVKDVLSLNQFDVNARNSYYLRETPLDFSLKHESAEIFNLLLGAGADINVSEYVWFSANEIQNQEIWDYVVKNCSVNGLFAMVETGDLPLHYALYENKTNIATWMMIQMQGRCSDQSPFELESFYMNEYHPILYTIDHANQETFEAFIKFATFMNSCTQDDETIPIYTYVRKRASKVFGKAYVDEIYQKYEVTEI